MQAVALNILRTARRPISRCACRIGGGVRYSLSNRNFHRSAISYRIPEDPSITEEDRANIVAEGQGQESEEAKVEDETADSNRATDVEGLTIAPKTRNGKHGSGRLRANRQRQPEGLPPVVLPEWFWDRNVKLVGGPNLGGSLAVFGTADGDETKVKAEMARQLISIQACDLSPTKDAKYSIHVDVYIEILSALRAGLTLRPPKNSGNPPISRPDTLLQCPKDGGSYYLDSVVETISTKLGADLVRLDALDIAQVVGTYIDDNIAWNQTRSRRTAILGYDAHKVGGRLEDYDKDSNAQDDTEGMEDEDDVMNIMKSGKSPPFTISAAASDASKRLASFLKAAGRDSKPPARHIMESAQELPTLELFSVRRDPNSSAAINQPSDQWHDLKVATVLESLISAADSKRASSSVESEKSESSSATPKDLIIQVRDYKELRGTFPGTNLLFKLNDIINKRWQDGRNIILVGTTASEEMEPALSRPEIQHLQSDILEGEKRTIFVPPDRREDQDIAFEADEKARIRGVNIRHIEDMIRKLADGQDSSIIVDIDKDLDSASIYTAGLEDSVWTYPKIHRLATTILGHDTSLTAVDGPLLVKALQLLASSDEAKFKWGEMELKQEDAELETMLGDLNEESSLKKQAKEKFKQIRKTCTNHEKKLLGGVIIPSNIHTTFDDVRAPKETIEALKTLTSLSLIRPEAFSYGVLATDKIPGLLLYGPPGTGKTLLAKAVAKESGATVLEVSGADVNDMFVGEGEKNVKAVFSLAKKLSPCIVFIDEADAIFASRGEAKRTGSHRELINQFLREWDGMTDLSAFIMVATNRPFDLDEAVLRRLPRRLLVDLPVEKDREAILNIHLKDEILDESVSLAELAKDTPFYSGSDLKNLSVAAALACIREENEAAANHTSDEPYVYPEKRILTKQHFDKALGEISASISEDMSTLTAIRKFDEKYGDRKGRRKKSSALGFGGTTVPEKDSEAARVRKMEPLEV
jgi:SpoVK/Ycf46/Vps4 family AAA+-type ATPase